MDYEKKYKEAFERAKQVYKTPYTAHWDVMKELIEHLFPELKESEDERIRKALIDGFKRYDDGALFNGCLVREILDWLEKQKEQEQLYIRFGEIPADEKSKIYQGEVEVGTEKGVSVYPAFKTDKEDIVLGLSLPITRTSLYTQQHLIEYDDRPCYLVNGDYVGKDTDGQPLIRNVKIIKKIDKYRAKEEKKGLFALEAERYFPELKESEDEKIIKGIIKYLEQSQFGEEHYCVDDDIVRDYITWLEKQGGQNPITDFSNLRTWKYIVDAVLTEKEGIGQYLDSPFTEEVAKKLQKRFGNIKQIPTEWSEEDEAMFQGVIETEQYMLDVVYGRKTFDVGNVSIKEECTKELAWLESLKDRIK